VEPDRRKQLTRDLQQVERHVAEGRSHIAKQVAIIAALERDGHDSATAKKVLAILQKTQQMHEEHREMILGWLQQ